MNIHFKIIIITILFASIFNIAAIFVNYVADIYRIRVFHKYSQIFALISGIFPFSLGEIMIMAGLLILLLFVLFVFSFFIKNSKFKKIRKAFFIFFAYVLVFIYFSETFNAFILYHTESIENQILFLYDEGIINNEEIMNFINENNYSKSDLSDINKLLILSDYVNSRLNELSDDFSRDGNGNIIYDVDMSEYIKCMNNISDMFPLLKGYYPKAKKIIFSNIMCQQYLTGIYFPFSMEANYNGLMYCVNFPSTICHELSHLKGYIREDEANFISYIACVNSENIFIEYSGLLSVQWYIENDLYRYADEELLMNHIYCNETVINDDIFVNDDVWEEVEDNAIISTDTLNKVTDTFLDTNLKINGVSSGIDNYSEVVKLLLKYYFG